MNKIETFQAQVRDLDAKISAVKAKAEAEKRDYSDEEQVELRGHIKGINDLKAKIDLERDLAASASSVPADRIEVVQDEADKPFATDGEFLQAVARAAMPRGDRLAGKPTGFIDKRLYSKMDPEFRAAASGMNESVPSEGGFLVGTDRSQVLLEKSYEASVIANLCNRLSVGANSNGVEIPYIDESTRVNGSRLGGVQAYWAAEATAATSAKKPKLGLLEMKLQKIIALAYASTEMLQDATQLGSLISRAFAQEFAFKLNDAIIRGTGAGQPLGLLNSNALVSVDKVAGQSADTINGDNVLAMYAAMWGASKPRGVWLVNQEAIPQLFKLSIPVGTSGQLIFMPAGGISGKAFDTLFGRPVFYPEQSSALGDQGDIIFADFGEYLLIEKGGLQSAQSMHVNFTTDEMAFRFTYRVNGQPVWSTALTPYKGAGTTSPYVTLDARA